MLKRNLFLILVILISVTGYSYSQTGLDSLNMNDSADTLLKASIQSADTILKSTDTILRKSTGEIDSLKTVSDSLKLKAKINNAKESLKESSDSLANELKQKADKTKESVIAAKDSVGNKLKGEAEAQKKMLNAKKDSLASGLKQKAGHQKEVLKGAKDSLAGKTKQMVMNNLNTVKKQILSVKPMGSISAGYEYGVLPFVAGSTFPAGGFRTEGNISVFAANIPVEFTFCYTTIRQVIGLNNYFRLSYDSGRYKEQLAEKMGDKEQLLQNNLARLKIRQQALAQKIMSMNYLQKYPDYKIPVKKDLKKKGFPALKNPEDSLSLNDSLKMRKDSISQELFMYAFPADQKDSIYYFSCPFDPAEDLSCSFPAEAKDSTLYYSLKPSHVHSYSAYVQKAIADTGKYRLAKKMNRFDEDGLKDSAQTKMDSLKTAYSEENAQKLYATKRDSISGELKAYTSEYDSINMAIKEVKTEIDRLKAYRKIPDIPQNPYLSKIQQFLSHINKLEIGLCHPANSVFLLNNVPLQGINFEYQKSNKFISVSYGTTMNNLLYNPHTLDGMLRGARNYYNYFDFGNLEAGRKIMAVKGGFGSKDNTHLYAGFLVGKGKADYLFPAADPASASKETNVVLELDGKYRFSQQLSVDLALGKSSVQEEDLSMEQVKKCVNEVFSGYHSYALLARVNACVKKTNTNLTFTTRWIDPYFKSFGLGFLRSDNLRFEIKAEQPVSSRIRYTIAYRREEDNLLKLYDYKNTFYSISNSLNLKLTRQFNLRLMYAPLFRTLKSGSDVIKDRNTISTVVLTWMPKSKKVNSQFNALYSRYMISGDSTSINFENFSYSNQFFFRSGFKTDMNISWFKNNLSDTTGNDTYLGVAGIGYTTKRQSSFTVAGKIAYKAGIEPQYGFVVKIGFRLYKRLFWESEIEKIIIGDYYNSFDINAIRTFPYLCKTRLILNF